MKTAERAANNIVARASEDAWARIVTFYKVVQSTWSEALSIPSGCGGTPFRADARSREQRLTKMMQKFAARYGQDLLDQLRKKHYMFYGMREEKR